MAAKIKSLLQWCKRQCEGYRDVEMTNMTSSWKSGLAFCAIIHRYRPDLIDYDSLSKENVYENNKLAFDVAQEHLNIPALLDPEDMVAMAVPDKLCIVTYVSQYYNCFSKMEPVGGPGVRQYCSPPKRALSSGPSPSEPEAKKVIPTKHLLSDQNGLVHQTVDATQRSQRTASSAASKRGTYGDKCHICGQKVYLMERHIEDGQLYHRRCIREKQKSISSPKRPKQAPSAFHWPTDKDSTKRQDRDETRVTSRKDENKAGQFNLTCQKTGHQVSEVSGKSTSSNLTKLDNHKPGASSNLVKMLYGAATPYPSSDHSMGKQTEKLSEPSVPPATSVSSRNISSHKHLHDVNKTKNKGPSILERAALFDNDPKPLFGSGVSGKQKPVSSTVRRAPVTVTRTSPQTTSTADKKSEVDTVTYTYHPGVASSTTNHAVTQPIPKGNIRSGLLQSLANIRQQKGQSDSQSPSTTQSLTKVKSNPTSAKDSASAFIGQTSALSDFRHSQNDENLAFQASVGDFSVGSLSVDGKKSILKQGSAHQLYECPSHKEPKTILKPRLNETLGTASVEDQLKPILKSRRCSEEADLETGSAGNPRPILKSASPTEMSQLVSSSPPKSILKSRETSPELIHRPSKSILKSKDSLEDMELDEDGAMSESKPKSILKHTHEDGSRAWDDMATSPIRSILKHALPLPESRSILKTPTSPVTQSANVNKDALSATVNDSLSAQSSEIKLPSPKSSPRAQINVNDKAKSPQPAPRSLFSKHSSDIPNSHRPNHPPSRDEVQSASSMDGTEEKQQQVRDRSTPKSILKTVRDTTEDKSEPCGVMPDKQIPEAHRSSGNPIMSLSLANRHRMKCDQQKADPINNFSAFNLNDSLVIHGKQNLASGAGKSINSSDRHQPVKSAWEMEVEARKGIQPRESKLQPPPRPVAPALSKNRSSSGVTSHTQGDKSSTSITNKHHEMISNGSAATKDPDLEMNRQRYSTRPANHLAASSSEGTKTSTPPPRPPPPITSSQGLGGQETGRSHLPSNNLNKIKDSELKSPNKHDSAMSNSRASLSRSPAFRIADSPQSSPESNRNALVGNNSDQSNPENPEIGHSLGYQCTNLELGDTSSKRKIVPDRQFSFHSIDFSEISPLQTPEPGKSQLGSVGFDPIQSRPLPSPPDQQHRSPPKRMVNAEARIKTVKIIEELEKLDKDLQILEKEGRALEEKIRAVADDDDVEDALMAKWFEMINKKNELIRKESELMYRKRQQELEDLHMDLEYELRLLLEKPEKEKTASDRVRENALIQELLETVNERNHIVDSMEEDRKRYIAEDQEIADMMAKTGLLGSENGKKKKHDKRKQHEKKNCLGKESPEKKKNEKQNHLNIHATKDRKHFKLSVG